MRKSKQKKCIKQDNNYTVKTVTSQRKKEQLHISNNLRTIIKICYLSELSEEFQDR